MGLRRTNMMKSGLATGGSLTLTAQANESFLVRALHVEPSTNDDYLTVKIERRTVGFWRVKGFAGNHLFFRPDLGHLNLMEYLLSKNIDVSVPIESGESLLVSRYAEAGKVAVVYDVYDAGDIRSTMPNGSKSNELTYIQYLTYGSAISADGVVDMDSLLNPGEFPKFPVGRPVPANHRIEILGIVGGAVVEGNGSVCEGRSTFLKVVKNGEIMHDDDLNGLIFEAATSTTSETVYTGGMSVIGPNTDTIIGPPLLFDKPIECLTGDEVNIGVYIDWTTGGSDFGADQIDVGLILRVTRT